MYPQASLKQILNVMNRLGRVGESARKLCNSHFLISALETMQGLLQSSCCEKHLQDFCSFSSSRHATEAWLVFDYTLT